MHCVCTPAQNLGSPVLPCGLKHGALWVRVTDDEGTDLNGASVTAAGATKLTVAGMATFDPLDAKDYEVVFKNLSTTDGPLHGVPASLTQVANVTVGQITFVAFEVPRLPLLKVKVSRKIVHAAKRQVAAKAGDCLCGVAAEAGFLSCQMLRDLPENAPLLKSELKDGDSVTLPPDPEKLFENATVTIQGPSTPADIKTSAEGIADFGRVKAGAYTIKIVLSEEDSKHYKAPADQTVTLAAGADHTEPFELEPLAIEPMNVRFVHGSAAQPVRTDGTVNLLNISNFVTNKGGITGLSAFPTGYGYDASADADPDAFKVEVWDPLAGGTVTVKLAALKPAYADAGNGKFTPTSYTPLANDGRAIDVVANQSTDRADTYQSKYLRLVVDEADRDTAGLPGQLLFVSDFADGLGTGAAGDNDTVEILDQKVRASYQVSRCAAASDKCQVSTESEIGGGERLRVRLKFSAFRRDPGVDTTPNGVAGATVKQHLRRRTYKWYRRVFAQANIAPKLQSVELVDPPAENMLCLSHSHGRAITELDTSSVFSSFLASVRSTFTGSASTTKLTFRIKTATKDVSVSVGFNGGETPEQAGDAIVAQLPPGFAGKALLCPLATNATNPSCDVLIDAADGERVTLLDVAFTPGAGMTVAVPRVDLMGVLSGDSDYDASVCFLTVDFKRILRATPVTDDAMYCVVVGQFSTPSLRGQAFLPCGGSDAKYRPQVPFRSVTIMAYTSASGPVLDGGDNLPFTSPHESCHTLCDLIHTEPQTPHNRTELMGTGTSTTNTLGATKRLSDGPYEVRMQKNGSTTMSILSVKLAETMRNGGPEKMEAW